jgi:hypothetical protein
MHIPVGASISMKDEIKKEKGQHTVAPLEA